MQVFWFKQETSMSDRETSVTRREMVLHLAPAAALTVAGIMPALAEDRSRSDPGPGNPALDAQNPDSIWPPATDSREPCSKLQVSVLVCQQADL
jgi:hypothetical protein